MPWLKGILSHTLDQRDLVICLGSEILSHTLDQRSCHMPWIKEILSYALDQKGLVLREICLHTKISVVRLLDFS